MTTTEFGNTPELWWRLFPSSTHPSSICTALGPCNPSQQCDMILVIVWIVMNVQTQLNVMMLVMLNMWKSKIEKRSLEIMSGYGYKLSLSSQKPHQALASLTSRLAVVVKHGNLFIQSPISSLRRRDSQSKPSWRPSPVVATEGCTNHFRFAQHFSNSNFSVISSTLMAFGKSCLFAKTRSAAFASSWELTIFSTSAFTCWMRWRSELSTTKIKPLVPWK